MRTDVTLKTAERMVNCRGIALRKLESYLTPLGCRKRGRLERGGTRVLLSATKPEHVPVLHELGVFDQLAHENHAFDNTLDAIAHARLHVARIQHEESDGAPATPRGGQHDE